MAVFTIQQAYQQLAAFVGAGQLREASSLYAAVRRNQPTTPDVLVVAASMASMLKNDGDSAVFISQAIAIEPELANPHAREGLLQYVLGNPSGAIAAYRRADLTSPLNLNRLATALLETGQLDESIGVLQRAIALKPDHVDALNNLGIALRQLQRFDESASVLSRAIAFKPDLVVAINNLGNTFEQAGRLNDALAMYERAVALQPNLAECHNNLGNALVRVNRFEDSLREYQRAVELNPNLADALINCGNALKETGDWDGAMRLYQRAAQVKPGSWTASNYLISLYYLPQMTPDAVLAEHRRWAASLPTVAPIAPPNDFDPNRRLRIGFISGDFRHHVVGYNLLPLFDHLDRANFEYFAYSASPLHDELTDRFRGNVDHWRPIHAMNDEQAARLIANDRIDILMDLSLHTGFNRLGIFNYRPAPLAGTFAGYPGTTGLSQIDFRLSDPQLDPPGLTEDFYAERTVRLPSSFWCYRPALDSPEVNALPALTNGFITFGYLGNFCKINPPVLALGAQVMNRTPRSRLMMISCPGPHRQHVARFMSQFGISADRIEFTDRQAQRQYLRLYNRIDLSLDTFPYNSHTTGLDALWMGVPLVTKVGPWAIGRAGFSHLTNVGLPELAAKDDHDFLETAAKLASDMPRLMELRSKLRQRLQASPLMEESGWAAGILNALRGLWVERCRSPR